MISPRFSQAVRTPLSFPQFICSTLACVSWSSASANRTTPSTLAGPQSQASRQDSLTVPSRDRYPLIMSEQNPAQGAVPAPTSTTPQQQPQGTPQQQNATPASNSVPQDQLVCQWSNCGERCQNPEQLYVSISFLLSTLKPDDTLCDATCAHHVFR